ncbi:hypothetical protein TARUN_3336 [Trichoderma arundinaceum]|uniref:Uncharacterized protein n=1 Tax=Trichoderma arundinaceum TaxID=490622 RepID=A0A395NSU5_TRIAR|nr:hypothetical protein TARUN_3336 [Trichoderma arundinaceum]
MTAPRLVAPKNLILESRPKTRALLDSMQALATVTSFTVHIKNPDTIASTTKDFELITSAFSASHTDNRPSTNNKRANLTTLYAGKGGEIINADTATANLEACPPPLYSEPVLSCSHVSNKRKRKGSDIDNDRHSTDQDHILLILKNICTRLDGIESRMGRLEDKVQEVLDAGRSPNRYGAEERMEMLEEIDNRIDDCITDLKIESHDIIQDLRDEIDGTLERLDNEASERIERLESDVEESTTKLVEKCLKKKLLNASLRIDGTVFLDI